MGFDGFISYSHAADGRLAPAVQRGLHLMARPWHRRRALWIFRDQTGLSVTPALWSSIQGALDDSAYFVLLASPQAGLVAVQRRTRGYLFAPASKRAKVRMLGNAVTPPAARDLVAAIAEAITGDPIDLAHRLAALPPEEAPHVTVAAALDPILLN
jgi:site-specific DNA-cytosine methylase